MQRNVFAAFLLLTIGIQKGFSESDQQRFITSFKRRI